MTICKDGRIELYGYDGFLASCIERILTGDRIGWLGKPEAEIKLKHELSQHTDI